jgi:hypothetical protein
MDPESPPEADTKEASQAAASNVQNPFIGFLWRTKLFWIPPLLLALLMLVLLYLLVGKSDVVAPFTYDL